MEQNLSILWRYMYVANKNGVHNQMNNNESCGQEKCTYARKHNNYHE